MKYDNPAFRLHSLLTQAFEVASTINKDFNKVGSALVWAKVFRAPSHRPHDLTRYTEEFIFLIRASKEAVLSLQDVSCHEPYLSGLNVLSICIQENGFCGPWTPIHNRLNKPIIINSPDTIRRVWTEKLPAM